MRERSVSQNYARMRVVVIVLIGVHLAYAGTHSLKYFYTATSGLPDHPKFVSVGAVDEQPFTYYDSKIRRMTSRQEWMDKAEGENYWKEQTDVSEEVEQTFMKNINVAKERFNHTGDVHTFQRMYGCEWDDQTGETNGFIQEGYNGEDFVYLDLKEMRWITPVQQGRDTVRKWNNDKVIIERDKNYFSTVCIEWLKKYLEYGKSSLRKTVSPQVSLLQKSSSSPVSCHATGFYPSGVTISWMKNGRELHEDVDLDELLPNEDGTFQKTSTINVKPDEWKNNKFSCVVEHQGKTKTVDEIWTNGGDSVPIGIIVGALAAVVLLILIGAAGFVVYKKKQGFKPVSGSDDGSNSSAQAVPRA